jgi:hypothetical protein
MSNPYQSPNYQPQHFQDPAFQPPAGANEYGWVSQTRIVAILNMVQGGLELPVGLMYVGLAFFFPAIVKLDQANNPNFRNEAPPEEMIWFLFAVYMTIGVCVILSGVLRLWAGFSNYRFRGRMLGIVSLVLGMVSVFSCYCAPTGLAILIYGLIVLLNTAVKMAFDMGDQGMSTDQILAAFMPYRPAAGQPPASPWPPT